MKKIYSHMLNYKLHTRLMIFFSTLVIVSMLLVGSVSYIASYRIVEDLAYSFSKQTVDSVADNLNDILDEAKNIAGLMEDNSIFQHILNSEMPNDIKKRYSTELEYDFELYQRSGYTINEFGGLYVLGNNGYNFKSHNVTFQDKDFRKEPWYREILTADSFIWLNPQYYSRVSKSIDNRYAAMGCPVINKANGERIGVVLVEIDGNTIKHIIREYGNTENGMIQILDADSVILFQKDGEVTEEVKSQMKKNESTSVFYYAETLNNGWIVESYIPKRIFLGRIINLGIWLTVIISVMVLMAVKITSVISKTVTNPINKLIELMEEAEHQEFDVHMHVKYKDELAVLGNKFNGMMAYTRHLITVNKEEQENLREAELKTLQMQINPHFLYNTLETVVWLVRTGDTEKAIRVVMSLSKFFRIGLSKGQNIITLHEELEHVKEYVNIQNMRYQDNIVFSIEVEDEALLEQTLPKLVLQPLVENAIYHGIQEKTGEGFISIKVGHTIESWIRISIIDNGLGMTDVQLERLVKGMKGQNRVGYGMYNTNQRLCKCFGEEAQIQIESEFGEGTTVNFYIPFREKGLKKYDKDNYCR